MNLALRHARDAADLGPAAELGREFAAWVVTEFQRVHGIDAAPSIAEKDALFLQAIEHALPPRGCTLWYEDQARPVATGCLRDLGNGEGEIRRMFVRPTHRGRGLSRHVLSALIAEAYERRFSALLLDTADFMTAALGLYESLGFRRIPRPDGHGVPGPLIPYMIFMRLQLA